MSNLLLTTSCNRRCPYCFARGELGVEGEGREITMMRVDWVIDFLLRSGVRRISLMGGEPTLHTRFGEIFERFWGAGFCVFLLTNGLIEDRDIEVLESVDSDGLIIMVNVNHPRSTDVDEYLRVREVLKRFGSKAILGFNITAPDADMDFLVELIEDTRISRCVRLGLAHPIAGGVENISMSPEDALAAGPRIVDFAQRCHERNIRLLFDCGFVMCMFSDKERKRLAGWGINLNFGCRAPIDIGPDLDVWRCFPLYRLHRRNLTEFETYGEVRKHFEDKLSWHSRRGCRIECGECRHLQSGECAGGCISHELRVVRVD